MANWPKFHDLETFTKTVNKYFEWCDEQEKPYTVTGLALYLDTSRVTLDAYKEKDGYGDVIRKAKLRIHNQWEEMLADKKRATVGVIFNLKNNWGWKNQDQMDVTTQGEKISGFNYVIPKDNDTDTETNEEAT